MQELYQNLLDKHGPQGWWPIQGKYHPRDFSYPHDRAEQFEIAIGAILTQNTTWHNVEKALVNLTKQQLLTPEQLAKENLCPQIKQAIRPAGYFNQKYKKLKIFSNFFLQHQGIPCRTELLQLWGIGPETADSILLYAYNIPTFIIDTYSKRVFNHYEKIKTDKIEYHQLQKLVIGQLPADVHIFQEYHALLVKEAKELKRNS